MLTLIFSRPHPLDEGRDQLALTALGSAISDAISRAAQHDSDRDLVVSVQRSLLAGALPERPGLRLGAQYLPAEARYGIGGDWYDAMPLADGRMMLIVGDVAGHGLEAAISMGQVRSAARALAPAYQPAGLLEALDQFICSTIREPLATAAVAIIDPASRTLRYCLAGHPPPLLRAPDGSVSMLDEASGILLGLETRDRPERVVRFAPGSSLVLFTDGLIERRDLGFDAGIAWLADELKKELPADPAELCDTLVRQSVARNGRDDDTAVLCAYLSLCQHSPALLPPFRRPEAGASASGHCRRCADPGSGRRSLVPGHPVQGRLHGRVLHRRLRGIAARRRGGSQDHPGRLEAVTGVSPLAAQVEAAGHRVVGGVQHGHVGRGNPADPQPRPVGGHAERAGPPVTPTVRVTLPVAALRTDTESELGLAT